MYVNPYRSVVSAICGLRTKGYFMDFRAESRGILCLQTKELIPKNQLKIEEYHFFDGVENPDKMHLVYAIECRNGLKGILSGIYGSFQDPFMQKISEC